MPEDPELLDVLEEDSDEDVPDEDVPDEDEPEEPPPSFDDSLLGVSFPDAPLVPFDDPPDDELEELRLSVL